MRKYHREMIERLKRLGVEVVGFEHASSKHAFVLFKDAAGNTRRRSIAGSPSDKRTFYNDCADIKRLASA